MHRYFWALLRDPDVIFKWRHNRWKLMNCKQIFIVAKGEEVVQWGDRSLQQEARTPPECWRHHRGKRGKRSFRFTTPDPSAQSQWRTLPVQKVHLLKSALTSSSVAVPCCRRVFVVTELVTSETPVYLILCHHFFYERFCTWVNIICTIVQNWQNKFAQKLYFQ